MIRNSSGPDHSADQPWNRRGFESHRKMTPLFLAAGVAVHMPSTPISLTRKLQNYIVREIYNNLLVSVNIHFSVLS